VLTPDVKYCFEDQDAAEAAELMEKEAVNNELRRMRTRKP
jgi:hypothetical protein